MATWWTRAQRCALQTRVRDLKYCREALRVASLGSDGVVKLWDPDLTCLQSVSAFSHGTRANTTIQSRMKSHVILANPEQQTPYDTISLPLRVDPSKTFALSLQHKLGARHEPSVHICCLT